MGWWKNQTNKQVNKQIKSNELDSNFFAVRPLVAFKTEMGKNRVPNLKQKKCNRKSENILFASWLGNSRQSFKAISKEMSLF